MYNHLTHLGSAQLILDVKFGLKVALFHTPEEHKVGLKSSGSLQRFPSLANSVQTQSGGKE